MRTFAQTVRQLRRRFPPLLPVRVYRRLRVQGLLGVTELIEVGGRPHHFLITICEGSRLVERTTLMHEWAHAISWQEGRDVMDHGPEWALAYGRIYRELIDE